MIKRLYALHTDVRSNNATNDKAWLRLLYFRTANNLDDDFEQTPYECSNQR